jgi:hypothetical protein
MSIRPGQRPRIFCIGLNRTGTKSLAQAFSMIGLRALHDARYATEAIDRAVAQDLPLLTWIDDYDCYADAPFYRWYRQLHEQYPESRFILNTREDASWVESRIAHDRRWNATRRAPNEPERPCDAAALLAFKQRKEAEIRDYFADRSERFLVLDVCAGEGWSTLCRFR